MKYKKSSNYDCQSQFSLTKFIFGVIHVLASIRVPNSESQINQPHESQDSIYTEVLFRSGLACAPLCSTSVVILTISFTLSSFLTHSCMKVRVLFLLFHKIDHAITYFFFTIRKHLKIRKTRLCI